MSESRRHGTAAGSGISLGAVIAVVLSWTVNKSILWCILHAICGWLYVVYWIFTHSGKF
jgi:uncharacterized membrane protein YoaK (UPF0700 family)